MDADALYIPPDKRRSYPLRDEPPRGPNKRRLWMAAAVAMILVLAGLGGLLAWRYFYSQDRQFFDPIDDPKNAAQVAEFEDFLKANYVMYFTAREILTPGGAHRQVGSKGYGLNRLPPRHLWDEMLASLFIIEELRERFGEELNIYSGYRAPSYNAAIGGARRSQHMRFRAFDVAPKSRKPEDVERLFNLLRQMRDEEKLFTGGIGRYGAWVHLDTRDKNANW